MTAFDDAPDDDRRPGHGLRTAQAERELAAAGSTVRSGVRWLAYELLVAAAIPFGTAFVYGAYRPYLGAWLLVSIPVACVLAFAIARRRRIFVRGEARESQIAVAASTLLLFSSMALLDQLAPDNPSPWTTAAIAVLPALPVLIAALRALRG